jgi:hypothetical protein
MRVRTGVNQIGKQPEMRLVEEVVERVFTKFGYEPEMTSCVGGVHSSPRSWHHFGMAEDFTLKHVERHHHSPIVAQIKAALPKPYQVIHHRGSHIHVECDIDAFPEYKRGSHQ